MKTLVVYNKQGQLIFTQTNATDSYNLIVEDVAENKEIVGVDVKTGKLKLVDRQATTEEKEALKKELEEKNKELKQKELENEELTDKIIELTAQNLDI